MSGTARAGRGRVSGRAFQAAQVQAGIAAMPGKAALHGYTGTVDCRAPWLWSLSVDMDTAFAASEPHAPRWDAGVGLSRTDRRSDEMIIWIEAHPASSTGAVAEMLSKLGWLQSKLRLPSFAGFRALTQAAQTHGVAYRWLARTGAIHIRPGSREHRLLIRAGLGMPRRRLTLP
jgi:hypothetical protein